MKNEKFIILSVVTGLFAVAAILVSIRISPDRLAGFGSILMLLGIVALEYRFDWKKIFSR